MRKRMTQGRYRKVRPEDMGAVREAARLYTVKQAACFLRSLLPLVGYGGSWHLPSAAQQPEHAADMNKPALAPLLTKYTPAAILAALPNRTPPSRKAPSVVTLTQAGTARGMMNQLRRLVEDGHGDKPMIVKVYETLNDMAGENTPGANVLYFFCDWAKADDEAVLLTVDGFADEPSAGQDWGPNPDYKPGEAA